ncbi:MAG: hypothetical protein N2C14_05610 [Planctomycetales bacterium]
MRNHQIPRVGVLLLAVLALGGCAEKSPVPQPTRVLSLHLAADGQARLDAASSSVESPIENLAAVFQAQRMFIRDEGGNPEAVRVIITADDDATCRSLIQAIEQAQRALLERFVIQRTRGYHFNLPLVPIEGMPYEDLYPPIKVRILADDQGQVAGFRWGEQDVEDLDTLHSQIKRLADSLLPVRLRLHFQADDHLKFGPFMKVFEKLAGDENTDGEWTPRFDQILPAPWPDGELLPPDAHETDDPELQAPPAPREEEATTPPESRSETSPESASETSPGPASP